MFENSTSFFRIVHVAIKQQHRRFMIIYYCKRVRQNARSKYRYHPVEAEYRLHKLYQSEYSLVY